MAGNERNTVENLVSGMVTRMTISLQLIDELSCTLHGAPARSSARTGAVGGVRVVSVSIRDDPPSLLSYSI